MKSFLCVVAGIVGALAFASCGGNVVVDDSAGGNTSWESYCEMRDAKCGKPAAKCQSQETCAKFFLRDVVEGPLVECLRTNCKQDVCFTQMREQFPPTDTGAQWVARHQAYLDACPTGNNDVQIIGWILTDDTLDGFLPCLDTPGCSAITACIDQTLKATVETCEDWL